jgi:hypothetical protein
VSPPPAPSPVELVAEPRDFENSAVDFDVNMGGCEYGDECECEGGGELSSTCRRCGGLRWKRRVLRMWLGAMNNLLLSRWRGGKIALLLLLLIIKMLQIPRSIARGHDHILILFSPYIAVRFTAVVVAVAARRHYRAP